jgi:hypothetical protein
LVEWLRGVNELTRANVEHPGPSEAGAREEVGRQKEQGVQGIRERVARSPEVFF